MLGQNNSSPDGVAEVWGGPGAQNSPQPSPALLWSELLEGFGLVGTQEGFVVVVEAILVIVLQVAEWFFFMHAALLLCWFTAAEGDAEEKACQRGSKHHEFGHTWNSEVCEISVPQKEKDKDYLSSKIFFVSEAKLLKAPA